MSNDKHLVLYTGVTNDIKRRAYEHKNGLVEGFTKRYHVKYLVYYEEFNDIEYAIRREKQTKGGSRKKKELLVNSINPMWRDLFDDVSTF